MVQPENLLSEWAALVFASFADAGVERVVVSPGSRSTPFVAGAIREPRLRLFDVIDERAAAFFALGQARVTGVPTLLLCTSGTAGAHYLPAIIEARHAGVPLLVLTADRPTEATACGAAQTIDQTKMFGEHVRRFFDLGMPDGDPSALRAVRRVALQAFVASQYPERGAVHVNARARKPLEPILASATAEGRAVAAAVRAVKDRPIRVALASAQADAGALEIIAAELRAARRGLIVCGPLPARTDVGAVEDLARRTGFPLLSESAS